MFRSDRSLLINMLEAALKIKKYTFGYSFDDFQTMKKHLMPL